MSYLNYQNNNILFNKVTQPSFTTSGRISRARYQVDNDNNIINYNNTTINAIDIDWNGAYLESLDAYINSTGDLLNQLNIISRTLSISSENLNDRLNNLDVYTKSESDDKYQEKGNYATKEYVDNAIASILSQINN